MAIAVTHPTVADGTFSAAGATNWDAGHTVTGAAESGANGDITSLTALVTNTMDGTPNTDHTSVGPITSTFNAGESITVMDLVYFKSDGKWWKTDADAAATSGGVLLAIALATVSADAALSVALPGSFVRDDTWNWTVGAVLYVGLAGGDVTATRPSATDDVVRVVGFAVSADVIHFWPSADYATVV